MDKTLMIEGLHCGHCVKKVEEALKGVNGVTSVHVTLDGVATLDLESDVEEKVLINAIEKAGYHVGEEKKNKPMHHHCGCC